MPVSALPDLNVLPAEELRALILAQHEQLLSREREIEHLKLLLVKLHRMQFGRKSEKLQRQIEQWSCDWRNWNRVAARRQLLPSCLRWQLLSLRQPRNRHVALCPIICRDKHADTNRKKPCVRNARASCAG